MSNNIRKKLIAGNWKCNGSLSFIQNHCKNVLNTMVFDPTKIDVLVAPMALHLDYVRKHLTNQNVLISAQNVSKTKEGAFTGEINANALKDFGINWTIVGHSERRALFDESSQVVASKVTISDEHKLNVIACIGETWDDKSNNQTLKVLEKQLEPIIQNKPNWNNITLAYEPVWAIGTGKSATIDDVHSTHVEIRKLIKKYVGEKQANSLRILYGGSVTAKNAKELVSLQDVDGLLIGGASLKDEFKTIVEIASKL